VASKRTTVTYLQAFHRPSTELPPPLPSVRIERLHQPTVQQYRELYNGVGRDYHWTDRNRLEDDVLRAVIQDPAVEIYQLTVRGRPAGYAELDVRDPQQIELAYFGLFPEFIGQGLGKYFLAWTLRQAWAHRPQRVWVHTCDLDHPAALHNYLKAGLEVYRQEVIEQPV
jgi:GNAT superfamily N-acetyltransferase